MKKSFQNQSALVSKLALASLLLANFSLLLLPKLILIQFTNERLWGEVGAHNWIGAIAQDLLFALIASITSLTLLTNPNQKKVIAAAAVNLLIVVLLLIDMRVRELWLQPLDYSLLTYALNNSSDLKSGSDLFFNKTAFYSITFKRLLLIASFASICVWTLILWLVAKRNANLMLRIVWPVAGFLILASAVLLYLAVAAPKYRYRMNENIAVSHPVNLLRASVAEPKNEIRDRANDFEQKPSPLALQSRLDRRILKNIKPFKNVVIVVYESIRWRDLNILNEGATISPVLSKLAGSGLTTKAFVSVPHSSKAYFAILTGRHPYPGIEMRELFSEQNDSIWHHLRKKQNLNTYAFSSMSLGFEGMGKLLNSFGVEKSYQTRDLAKTFGVEIAAASSFGSSDEHLYSLGATVIAKGGGNFCAVFFPLAAHYPYECKGSVLGRHNRLDYDACLAESDTNLGKLLAEFQRLHLMDDTLFVIVGDHGESFGEHGLYVHNSSMYHEEVTVPLVFWSEDGRLTHRPIAHARQIDIAPTIADLMAAMDLPVAVQGTSILRQPTDTPAAFMATFFDGLAAALYEHPFKYILDLSTDTLTVFDLTKDTFESSPLPVTDGYREAVTARIKSFLSHQENAFPSQ